MKASLKPAVTVAAMVCDADRFLLVEEQTSAGIRINQPAGHLEAGETPLAALARETLEETGWHVEPEALIGIYQWHREPQGVTVLRFAFAARRLHHDAERRLDEGILRTLWLNHTQLQRHRDRLRSPLVLACVEDYLAGRRFPLEILRGIVPEAVDTRHSGERAGERR